MIEFQFSYKEKKVAEFENVSNLFRKDMVDKMYNEAFVQIREILLTELSSIREDMEDDNGTISCNYNAISKDFEFEYSNFTDATLEKINQLVKR